MPNGTYRKNWMNGSWNPLELSKWCSLPRPELYSHSSISFSSYRNRVHTILFSSDKKNNCNIFQMLNRFVFKHQKLETYFAAQFWTDIVSTPTRFENGTWNQFNNKKNSLLLVHLKTWFATLNSHNGRSKRREKLEVALYTRKRSRGGKKNWINLISIHFSALSFWRVGHFSRTTIAIIENKNQDFKKKKKRKEKKTGEGKYWLAANEKQSDK